MCGVYRKSLKCQTESGIASHGGYDRTPQPLVASHVRPWAVGTTLARFRLEGTGGYSAGFSGTLVST